MDTMKQKPIIVFLLNLAGIVIAYYASLLIHEWGHGFVAWLYGVKSSPFDIQYGGYFLQNADENVDYINLMSSGRNLAVALIGIAGPAISLAIVITSLLLLTSKKFDNSPIKIIFTYWILIFNMIPTTQYLSISPFAPGGDTGHFAQGLNISPWWVFIPGTIFLAYLLTKILRNIIPKAYAIIPIKGLFGQNIFLLTSLCIMFLLIYTHGYNPLTDPGVDTFTKIMVAISIALVPILFILCNPVRHWKNNGVKSGQRTGL